MNLHLLWDEKIIKRIISTFESVFPHQNLYVIFKPANLKIHYITDERNCNIITSYNEFHNIDYSTISKVNIHGLDVNKVKFCLDNIPKTIPIYWHLWGAELYNVLLFERGYKLYFDSHPPFSFKDHVSFFFKHLGYKGHSTNLILKLFKNFDVTMICEEIEYQLFRNYYPHETIKLKNISDYFYYPVDDILGATLINKQVNGNVILIGNSCSWTNNHSYVFDKIKNLNFSGKNIIVPLSYGGNLEYKTKVIENGMQLFGKSFKPLENFLPLNQYNELLTKAEVCIYGNWRQEAVGNILVSLYLGAKVFLSERSPLFKILRNKDFTVFPLEAIDEEAINLPLLQEFKSKNRDIVKEKYSLERLLRLTYDYFK